MFRLLGNLLWFLLGGLVMGLAWCFFGLLACVTIIGIPWVRSCFVMAMFAFFPFGKEAVSRKELHHKDDIGTGILGILGNIIWFLFAGLWLAIGHLVSAVALFITIIGIPFGIQHVKLAFISLAPIGMKVVNSNDVDNLRH